MVLHGAGSMQILRNRAGFIWLVLLGVSLAVAVAIPLTLWARSPADPGSVGARQVSAMPSPAASSEFVPLPIGIVIPSLDVDTRVLPVGLDSARALDIPADIRLAGWYELGVAPGADRGSAVIVGHRDGLDQGHGVFYDLGALNPGDHVRVLNSAQQFLDYTVIAREFIPKKRLPLAELFAIDGSPRLTLVSCGGVYDSANGGYQDNVVVTAVPAPNPKQ